MIKTDILLILLLWEWRCIFYYFISNLFHDIVSQFWKNKFDVIKSWTLHVFTMLLKWWAVIPSCPSSLVFICSSITDTRVQLNSTSPLSPLVLDFYCLFGHFRWTKDLSHAYHKPAFDKEAKKFVSIKTYKGLYATWMSVSGSRGPSADWGTDGPGSKSGCMIFSLFLQAHSIP